MPSIIDKWTGEERILGNNMPAKLPSSDRWTVFGDVPQTKLVLRSEWESLTQKFDFQKPGHQFAPAPHDQNGIGQCNPEATVTAQEFARASTGLEHIDLSAADLYDRINGGSDRGSLLEDALEEMTARGVGTAATSGKLWKRGIWKGAAPAEERMRFRVSEAYLCPTFDHLYSAVLGGFAVISGIPWFDNFDPDNEAWLPLSGSGNYGGHAVFGCKPTMRAFGSRTVYGIWHMNSWGARWGGFGGWCVFGESIYRGPIGGWWAVRAVTDEGGTVPAPKFN